jgi:hypothetical protein
MKNVAIILFACLGLLGLDMANAASQDECAEWICLPGGFPSGCGGAHSAMQNRIARHETVLPDFDECAANPPTRGGSHMSYSMGIAAYIPTRTVCPNNDDNQWWLLGAGQQQCRTVQAHYVDGTSCWIDDSGNGTPDGCTATRQSVKVFTDGNQVGTTYYW